MIKLGFMLRAVFITFLLFSLGCQPEEIQKESTGIVEATSSYLESFGTPPQGKAGRAYAAVGYLPVKGVSDKLGPLPIFLFTEENQLEKVLNKLVSGDLITSQKQGYYNPFPADLELVVKLEEGKLLTIDLLTNEDWDRNDRQAGAMALKETSLQFSSVEKVNVMLNGSLVQGMPEDGFHKNSDLMIEVPPPILILMAGAWEEDENEPEEILVEFDRPVKVNSLELFHEDGRKVEGEYYKSIFQMAVVVHPKFPELFQEGTALRAKWNVTDELGRANSGIDTMPLKRLDH